MLGFHLVEIYEKLIHIGATKSKRDFSRNFLGHHWSYLRDIEQRHRNGYRVPDATVAYVKVRLDEISRHLSPCTRREIDRVIADIDQHTEVVRSLGYGRRSR